MKTFILSVLSIFSSFAFAANVENINAETLVENQAEGWLLIDVRSAEEYAEGHVPGAINIAHSDLEQHIDQILAYKDKPVVVYCRSGYRAGKAADVLLEHNFSQVKHLEGDMQGWLKAGRDIAKP